MGADAMVNENFDAASPAMLYGRRASATTGLTWGYYGGRYKSNLIANGTVTLTPSATNYIVASKATGAVSVSTSTTNWNNRAGYERLYQVVTNANGIGNYQDHRDLYKDVRQSIIVACSDESTDLTVGLSKVTFRMPYAFTLLAIRGSLSTPATGSTLLTVEVNVNGSPILSTPITFDSGEKTTATAATPPVISNSTIPDDAEVTIDITDVGDVTPGRGLKIAFIGAPA